jgi:hypothetical protein
MIYCHTARQTCLQNLLRVNRSSILHHFLAVKSKAAFIIGNPQRAQQLSSLKVRCDYVIFIRNSG